MTKPAAIPQPRNSEAGAFYIDALALLRDSGIPFLLGGTFAVAAYTGLSRPVKDLDAFCKAGDYPRLLAYARSWLRNRGRRRALDRQDQKRRALHRRDLQLDHRRQSRHRRLVRGRQDDDPLRQGGADHREEPIKHFVAATIGECLRLENALHLLTTERIVVLLHYAPVLATVIGEAEQIFPFLGSSRLAETIDRFPVSAVLHGHAHHGSHAGRTLKGIPVYNCARMVPKPGGRPYALIEV
jgi:hypothetical protein